MPENDIKDASKQSYAIPLTMWITIAVAVGTTGFNLYDKSNNLQLDNMKKDYDELKAKVNEMENKINAQALIIVGYDRDMSHMKTTLDRIDKNVESMNGRITNAEIGSAIKRAISEWGTSPKPQ